MPKQIGFREFGRPPLRQRHGKAISEMIGFAEAPAGLEIIEKPTVVRRDGCEVPTQLTEPSRDGGYFVLEFDLPPGMRRLGKKGRSAA